MAIEEKDFYSNLDSVGESSTISSPKLEDLALDVLPEPHRIHDVDVNLPDGPMGSTLLFYKAQESPGSSWKPVVEEYDYASRSWKDWQLKNNATEE